MAKKINITAQLNAATTDGILADAAQIYDAEAGKFQREINAELPGISEGLAEAQKDIEDGKKEVASIKKTVENLATSPGTSTASSVMYDNDKSGLPAFNVQDAVDTLNTYAQNLDAGLESLTKNAVQGVVVDNASDEDSLILKLYREGDTATTADEVNIPVATIDTMGVMSAEDKANLDRSLRAVGFGYNENSELELWAMENGENQRSPLVVPAASKTSSGVMTAADKRKLDELEGSTFTPLGEDEITTIFNNTK